LILELLIYKLIQKRIIMIRKCKKKDFEEIYAIINDSAIAYKGVIPSDRWKDPYMPREELHHEIVDGVVFYGYEEDGKLVGVMGIQDVQDVTLIRHSYVRTAKRGQGIGGKLLARLRRLTDRPVLIGTWADALWAIRFYEKHGFRLVIMEEKDRLLKKYWSIPERQIETSVVLADLNYFTQTDIPSRKRRRTLPPEA
jgi:N-acetylglutamate synthase-like GNAT family acetyltransferase